MGCFGSRLDKRASAAAEDFNSVGLQFHGGEGCHEDKYSADNFVFLQGVADKYSDLKVLYPTADGKATEDKGAVAAYIAAYKFVEATLKGHEDAVAKDAKAGTELVGGKHSRTECIAQLKNTIESFKTSTIEIPADPVAKVDGDAKVEPAKDGEAPKTDAEGGEAEYEGGEDGAGEDKPKVDGDAKVEGMATVDPRNAHVDDGAFVGFAETPALYLRNALVNEYFGDLVKQRIVAIQFLGKDGLKHHEGLAGCAGYLTSGLATTAKESADVWFSGLVGELDQASLNDLKKDAPLSFPGWVQGWASEEDASNYLKTMNSDLKKDVKQVIIKATGAPTIKVLGNRLVSHRLHGVVSADAVTDAKTNITSVTIVAKAYDERTLQDSWIASTAVAAEKPAEKPADKPADDTKPPGETAPPAE